MPTTTKQIMGFVKNILNIAADEDWTIEDVMEHWDTKEEEIKKIVETEEKPKKPSTPKDPLKPKRAKTAYLFFSQDVRPGIKAEMSDAKSQEVTKEIAVRWKELKESTKRGDKAKVTKYTNLAEEDKKRAEKELSVYDAKDIKVAGVGYPPISKEAKPKKDSKPSTDKKEAKPKKDSKPSTDKKDGKPKRGRSAYIFFCSENRDEVKANNPDVAGRDITKILSDMWKEVKEDEDSVQMYKDMAAKDKKRAERELAAYPSDDDEDYEEPKPKKQKNTNSVGFKKFVNANKQDFKDENPDMKATDLNKMMKEEWSQLDADEQEDWANEEQE